MDRFRYFGIFDGYFRQDAHRRRYGRGPEGFEPPVASRARQAAVAKRTAGLIHGLFLPLSSGYDSGALRLAPGNATMPRGAVHATVGTHDTDGFILTCGGGGGGSRRSRGRPSGSGTGSRGG